MILVKLFLLISVLMYQAPWWLPTYMPLMQRTAEQEVVTGVAIDIITGDPLPIGTRIWFLEIYCTAGVGCAKVLDKAFIPNGLVTGEDGTYAVDVTISTADYFLPVIPIGCDEGKLPDCIMYSINLIPRGEFYGVDIQFPFYTHSVPPDPDKQEEFLWDAPIVIR